MANKMLIDASHPEETRVVVTRGSRVEEFDFESASKKQLRGNIYLAKVTRVEPSLQAAFVDYGGNRHGFLAFSEIHPDYYQIPVSDRQALIDEEARAHRDAEDEESSQRRSRRHRRDRNGGRRAEKRMPSDAVSETAEDVEEAGAAETSPQDAYAAEAGDGFEAAPAEAFAPNDDLFGAAANPDADESVAAPYEADAGFGFARENDDADTDAVQPLPPVLGEEPQDFAAGAAAIAAEYLAAHPVEAPPVESDAAEASTPSGSEVMDAPADADEPAEARRAPGPAEDGEDEDEAEEHAEEEEQVEQLGGDAMDETPLRQPRFRKQYKIQEVIKRRQVLLVQVVKEERGNKGAALTTYLSLAGRYSVLMPNTARGGGISRKITDSTDRQRLKSIAQELEVPEGMGVILRTAGASRTKPEVKRDFEYLLRMWETVRETTLKSTAPTLVYEEGSLIKRAIRDLYNKDIDDVLVSGERGYREARDFMRLLMPTHVNCVQPYRDPQPLFSKQDVESQLDGLFVNHVTLKSGGYIVINQTEALVAIDVNSGRSTREHNIEDTALRTNLEAADEVARQLRLRDLAGLIVVDFIDMEESRNNRAVERRLKDALKNDRARIQVGRISHFGLLEMSRQRIRTGVLEGSTEICPHCSGSGMLRSTASIALHVLRIVEEALIKSASHDLVVRTRSAVAFYILNEKRANLRDLERRFGVCVTIEADDSLIGSTYHALERGAPASGGHEPGEPAAPEPAAFLTYDSLADTLEDADEEDDAATEGDEADAADGGPRQEDESEADSRRRRRRRRRRGRGGDRETSGVAANAPQPSDDALELLASLGGLPAPGPAVRAAHEEEDDEAEAASPHEAGPEAEAGVEIESGRVEAPAPDGEPASAPEAVEADADAPGAEPAPAKPRRSRRAKTREAAEAPEGAETAAEAVDAEEEEQSSPRRARRTPRSRAPRRAAAAEAAETPAAEAPGMEAAAMEAAATPVSEPSADREAAAPPPAEVEILARAPESDAPESDAPESGTPEPDAPETGAEDAADPDRPKRSGWWQRAKATLTR
ncbi:Rne/Rng family ribonuclease [Methylocella sp.]|uniref:Rne/Rng family ribonuclease n=1 Tax=Methylocella sp. TaxID=1978226 RepID=UPI0037837923